MVKVTFYSAYKTCVVPVGGRSNRACSFLMTGALTSLVPRLSPQKRGGERREPGDEAKHSQPKRLGLDFHIATSFSLSSISPHTIKHVLKPDPGYKKMFSLSSQIMSA